MMKAFQNNVEDHKAKGYRFSRLAFWSYTIAFYVTLLWVGLTEQSIQFYLYYCVFSSIALGVFTVKDVLNTRAFLQTKNGNGNGHSDESSEESK